MAELAAVVALCCVQFALGYSSAWNKSPVYDEPAHLFAGYSYLKLGDFRMMPSHPPLAEMLAAAPLLFCEINLPDLESPDSLTASAWRRGAQWQIGRGWLYLCGNDPDRMLRIARVPTLLVMVFGGVCLYRVTRAALGPAAGLFALALWTFCPSILAHGRWVTTDLPIAVCFFGAMFGFWRLTAEVSPGTFAAAALWLAALFLTKFSALLFVPMAVLLIAVRIVRPEVLQCRIRPGFDAQIHPRALRACVLVAVALVVATTTAASIWAAFGFRYSGAVDGGFHYALYGTQEPVSDEDRAWRLMCTDSGGRTTRGGRVILWAAEHRLLPEAYLFGLAYTLRSMEGRLAYLRGEIRWEGWWYYFPYVLAIKTPIAVLLLGIFGVMGWQQALRAGGLTSARECVIPVIVFLVVYGAATMSSRVNIGHRHLLPVYPFVYVIGAGATWWLRRGTTALAAGAVAVLLVLHAVTSLRTWPHYLSFFNAAVGGAAQGWRHLSDSNIDWGQDLIHMRRYLDRHPEVLPEGRALMLSYFGTGDPCHYLKRVAMLPSSPGFLPDVVSATAPELFAVDYAPLVPGLYAVSVTQLTGLYLPERGPWTAAKQARLDAARDTYAVLRAAEGNETALDAVVSAHRFVLGELFPPEAREAFEEDPTRFRDNWGLMIRELARVVYELRFARLLELLKQREPLARVGGSVCLYKVSKSDLSEALE